jgi:hypothetical protein
VGRRADAARRYLWRCHLWQSHLRNDALRRLHLAAQSSDTLFFVVRPNACARDASPAPLRLALEPAAVTMMDRV